MLTRDPSLFSSYRVYRGAEAPANTDHRLVVGVIKIQVYRKPQKPTARRLDVSSLTCNTSITAKYNISVSNKFEALGALEQDPESAWSTIRSSIRSAASESIGNRRPQRRPWLTPSTLDVLDQKRAARLRGDTDEARRL